MITRINHTLIYVTNVERAIDFYTNKLGFRINADVMFEQSRWVTLSVPEQPDLKILLVPVEEGVLFESLQAKKIQELMSEETLSFAVFECSDLRSTYEELKAKGVKFLMTPSTGGFLGQYEAAFTDDSGNWYRLTEKKTEMNPYADFTVAQADFANFLKEIPVEKFFHSRLESSWSAALVAEHVTLSYTSIIKWLKGAVKSTERSPDEHIAGLRKLFLDFSTRMISPKSVLPKGVFKNKHEAVSAFEKAGHDLGKLIPALDLSQTCLEIEVPELGGSTRLELVAFATVHTQRHLHQLQEMHKNATDHKNGKSADYKAVVK